MLVRDHACFASVTRDLREGTPGTWDSAGPGHGQFPGYRDPGAPQLLGGAHDANQVACDDFQIDKHIGGFALCSERAMGTVG
jgi:hypothetical protein